jgi:hypothetical protein
MGNKINLTDQCKHTRIHCAFELVTCLDCHKELPKFEIQGLQIDYVQIDEFVEMDKCQLN